MKESISHFQNLNKEDFNEFCVDGIYGVSESTLQFNPNALKTSLDDENMLLKPENMLKSDQLIASTKLPNEPKPKELSEREKVELEMKKFEKKQQKKAALEQSIAVSGANNSVIK